MANIRIAQRYAEALMIAAEEQKLLDRITADMDALEQMMRDSREFHLFLKSPVINREKKQTILAELFSKRLHTLSLDFLKLLAEKGREDVLQDIITQFFALRDVKMGIVSVNIRAATELSEEQKKSIQKRFEEITKKSVRLTISREKDLKGGFLARVGDTVFDGSVKRQLELLKERFSEGIGVN